MPQLGEFDIIERYFTRASATAGIQLGIGDDAAIVEPSGAIAVAVDTLVAGSHFPQGHPAASVGHRSLAVNLSDLAAVGAVPRWATLALTLPTADETWLEQFAAGWFALAERYEVALIGGDTTSGPLAVTVQVIGDAPVRPLLRSGAEVGDVVYVSGSLGGAAAALDFLPVPAAGAGPEAVALIERFSYPQPRVELGRALAGLAHAAIDVSDGLLADLGHICRASRCGARIELDAIPMAEGLAAAVGAERAHDLALGGGDDYELCFTVAATSREAVAGIAQRLGICLTEIGTVVAVEGVAVIHKGQELAVRRKGFTHF